MWTARHALGRVALHSTRRLAASAPRPLSIAHVVTSRHLCVTPARFCAAAAPERHEFQAETKNLMDIVAKSLYSDSEGHRTITFEDTGIGMDRRELLECLGTIAKSGSKEFIEKNKDNAEAVIGQFGVGFYSAFMVADSVVVTTRKVGEPEDKGLKWTWKGQLAKQQKKSEAFQRPCYTIHYKTDTPVSLRSVLYIPQHRFSMLEYAAQAQNRDCGLSLYARRVLIKPNAKELLPNYLHFLMGVVDSEDIPLNLSREMLQNNPVLRKLRKILTDKVLSFLLNEMKKDSEKYEDFYKQYSIFLKEGIVTQVDHSEKEEIAKLMLFESSNLKAGVLTNLTEYCKRMQEDQKEIYYMFSPSRQLAESSPYYELVRSQNKEVLFLYEPADEVVFLALHQFNMKPLVGVEKWAESAASKGEDKDKAEGKQFRDVDKKELLDWIKTTLGSVKVFDIAGNHRPSEHPVMLTIKHEMGAARHLLRTGEIKDMEHLVFLQPCLHVNLTHPLIKSLYTMKRTDPKTAELLIAQIYDNALITSGLLKDTSGMVHRLNKLLTQLAGSKSTILTP
ncbi:Hsp90 protein [Ancylostoma duodenale]|uniref:Hsp90 protein n=1 Tax=Ancylostoma duodenale TaxID=51022 RepID=A0A0C2D0X4_9BILA|nr:Hsp90 protein [Ancylostoma duodenale]